MTERAWVVVMLCRDLGHPDLAELALTEPTDRGTAYRVWLQAHQLWGPTTLVMHEVAAS